MIHQFFSSSPVNLYPSHDVTICILLQFINSSNYVCTYIYSYSRYRCTLYVSQQRIWQKLPGPSRGGGNWGILPWAPLCLWAPKDQYTLIEQSNTPLKQSQHIFALGPSSSLGCPGNYFYPISVNWTHGLDSQAGLTLFKLLNTL